MQSIIKRNTQWLEAMGHKFVALNVGQEAMEKQIEIFDERNEGFNFAMNLLENRMGKIEDIVHKHGLAIRSFSDQRVEKEKVEKLNKECKTIMDEFNRRTETMYLLLDDVQTLTGTLRPKQLKRDIEALQKNQAKLNADIEALQKGQAKILAHLGLSMD